MAPGSGREPRDEEGIRRTLARYCQLLDDGRWDEWVTLFTDDIVMRVMGQTVEGPDAVRAFIEPTQPPEARGRHLLSEPLIDVAPVAGEASATTDFAFVTRANTVQAAGRYHDRFRRVDGDWRIAEREIALLSDPS